MQLYFKIDTKTPLNSSLMWLFTVLMKQKPQLYFDKTIMNYYSYIYLLFGSVKKKKKNSVNQYIFHFLSM